MASTILGIYGVGVLLLKAVQSLYEGPVAVARLNEVMGSCLELKMGLNHERVTLVFQYIY